MSLVKYQRKRKFDKTPEPRGAGSRGGGALHFVVQKHHARRLHYDFRLELDGTLKSWAVPKGPSLNPGDKRLAVMVEDHPLDYATFEGVIPEGNYGAGTVMVWDKGTYHARETSDLKQSEELLRTGLANGRLTFVLHGKKLRGEFTLIRLKDGKGKNWLLIKKQDAFAAANGRSDDSSASSGRTMPEIAKAGGDKRLLRKQTLDLSDAPTAPMPHDVKPMLAQPASKPFDHPDWIFEVKWDGYRAIAEVRPPNVRLYSRRLLSFENRYTPVVDALRKLQHEVVLDGEVVALDDSGTSQFQMLQNYQRSKTGRLVYYVFDILWANGHDLRQLPLLRRKEILGQVIGDSPHIQLSEHIAEKGVPFFAAAADHGLEGVVAKQVSSTYHQGTRSPAWLKIKTHMRQEAVIGGFTAPRGSRQHFGSLVLGVYEGDDLIYIGRSGSGLTGESLADIRQRLEPLIQKECPFKQRPQTDSPARWVRPSLVCEVSFGGWTEDGHMRFPIFMGLREDKPAKSVHREKASPPEQFVKTTKRDRGPTAVSISGRNVRLTNLGKVYWPDEGYVKGDLIAYYKDVASVILPYMKDRPQSLHRHPNGIKSKSFFQKDMARQPPPEWVETVNIRSESDGDVTRYLLCQDEPALLYMANLGCIELNPWHSRIQSPERPDYLLIDLDPEDIAFDEVVRTAQEVRKVLEKIGAEAYCKTSGKRGLHIYVPLEAQYTHDAAKQFGELVAKAVYRRLPETTSIVRMPAKRQGRVYLDFLQNGQGKTLAAPYSVRPYPGATVSTPLKWSEVKSGLDPSLFTIRTTRKRLDKVGDLWSPVLGQGIDLEECLRRMAALFK